MHRDLHPGNIMKCGDRWVIVDLGFSKEIKSTPLKPHTSLGTKQT